MFRYKITTMHGTTTRTRIASAAGELVDALHETMRYRTPYDRAGSRSYAASRARLVEALVGFGRELVRAARTR